MKRRAIIFVFLLAFTLSAGLAQSSLEIQATDTVQTVLQRQVGQPIELRMKSGEKLGGKLDKVNEKVAHLTQLTGAEYFEAVVAVDEIAAVIVRAKK